MMSGRPSSVARDGAVGLDLLVLARQLGAIEEEELGAQEADALGAQLDGARGAADVAEVRGDLDAACRRA